MSIKTRRHMRAVSLVMSIAIVGVLAAFLVLASNPGPTQAQDDKCAAASGDALELLRDLGLCTAPADTSDSAQDDRVRHRHRRCTGTLLRQTLDSAQLVALVPARHDYAQQHHRQRRCQAHPDHRGSA